VGIANDSIVRSEGPDLERFGDQSYRPSGEHEALCHGQRIWTRAGSHVTSGLSASDAERIAQAVAGSTVRSCRRFATGLRHWVYDVEIADGTQLVVRLTHADNRAEVAGGVFWHEQLSMVGVPVPELIAADVEAAQPYMVLQRLAGTDLGNAFCDLSDRDLEQVATAVADCQARTAQLRRAGGFGYALDYTTPLHTSWVEVLRQSIADSARRIESARVVDPRWSKAVAAKMDEFDDSFDDVSPKAFLHDATTKNVIVHHGAVTGIVDTDEMAFGDPLWAVALTHTSLLAARRSTDYVDQLVDAMGITNTERMSLYTAIFALDFLSEVGHQFNRDRTPAISSEEINNLTAILASSLRDL
jgi:aminoglycoside phosphotransferase